MVKKLIFASEQGKFTRPKAHDGLRLMVITRSFASPDGCRLLCSLFRGTAMDSISPGCGEAQPLALFGPIAHRSTVELHALLQEAVDIVLSVSFGVGRNIWAPQASRGSAAGRWTAPPL